MNAWSFQTQIACGGCQAMLVPEPYDASMTWLCSCMNPGCDRRGVKLMVPMMDVDLIECASLEGITREMVEAEAEIVRCALCGEALERVGVSKWQHTEPCSATEDFSPDDEVPTPMMQEAAKMHARLLAERCGCRKCGAPHDASQSCEQYSRGCRE